MANERCPKCRSEMVERQAFDGGRTGRSTSTPNVLICVQCEKEPLCWCGRAIFQGGPNRGQCPATPDQHRIAEFEQKNKQMHEAALERARQINQLKEKLRNPEQRFADLQSERDALKAELEEANTRRQKAEDGVRQLNSEHADMERNLYLERDKVEDLQSNLDAVLAQVGVLHRRCETVVPVLDEAMNLLSWLKHDLYGAGKGDYNGKIPCCQEDGEQQLAQLRATIADTSATAQQFVEKVRREALEEFIPIAVEALATTPNPHAFNDWDGEKWVWGHRGNLEKMLRSAAILGEKEKG